MSITPLSQMCLRGVKLSGKLSASRGLHHIHVGHPKLITRELLSV